MLRQIFILLQNCRNSNQRSRRSKWRPREISNSIHCIGRSTQARRNSHKALSGNSNSRLLYNNVKMKEIRP